MPNDRDDYRRNRGVAWRPEEERGPRRMERGRFPEEDRGRWRSDELRSVGSPGVGGATGNRFDQRFERGPWGDRGGDRDRADRERDREWERRAHEEYMRYGGMGGGMGDEDWSPAQSNVERLGRSWGGDIGFSGGHRGKGPVNYVRADDRIREDVCDHLTEDEWIDASQIDVSVRGGEVTLTGTVSSREMKRRAEDLAERQRGVKDVHNQLRLAREAMRSGFEERDREDSDDRGSNGNGERSGLPGRQRHPS